MTDRDNEEFERRLYERYLSACSTHIAYLSVSRTQKEALFVECATNLDEMSTDDLAKIQAACLVTTDDSTELKKCVAEHVLASSAQLKVFAEQGDLAACEETTEEYAPDAQVRAEFRAWCQTKFGSESQTIPSEQNDLAACEETAEEYAPDAQVRAEFRAWCQTKFGSESRENFPGGDVEEYDLDEGDYEFADSDETRFWAAGSKRGTSSRVLRTYSTSLRIPSTVKQEIANFVGWRTPEYYHMIGLYERVFALGVKTLSTQAAGLVRCQEYIREMYRDLFQIPQVFFTEKFRARYDALGQPSLADPRLQVFIKSEYPELGVTIQKFQQWGAVQLLHKSSGWPYLLLEIPNLNEPKEWTKLEAPPRLRAELRQWGRMYGRGATKLEESVYAVLYKTFRQSTTIVKKLIQFKKILRYARYSYAIGNYLLTGYLPFHVKRHLAEKWDVSPGWVRDLTFGWRRRLNKNLPLEYRADKVDALTKSLQRAIERELRSILGATISGGKIIPKYRTILKILAKRRLLHKLTRPGKSEEALPNGVINEGVGKYLSWSRELHKILAPKVRSVVQHLSGTQGDYASLLSHAYPHSIALTPEEFTNAAEAVIQETGEIISQEQASLSHTSDPEKRDKITFLYKNQGGI